MKSILKNIRHVYGINHFYPILFWNSVQFSSVTKSCPTLCDPMDCSTPGFPEPHQLLKLALGFGNYPRTINNKAATRNAKKKKKKYFTCIFDQVYFIMFSYHFLELCKFFVLVYIFSCCPHFQFLQKKSLSLRPSECQQQYATGSSI